MQRKREFWRMIIRHLFRSYLEDEIEIRTRQLTETNERLREEITGRTRAEEILQESEGRYSSLFENSADAIVLSRTDGKIVAANPEACRVLGYPLEELLRLTRNELVDLSDFRYHKAVEERLSTGRFRGELVCIRKGGGKFPVEASSFAFKDSQGGGMIFATFRDITEQRKAEAELRLSEERYRSLFNAETDAIILVDCDTNLFLDANPAAIRIYGYSHEEFLSLRAVDISAEPQTTQNAIATRENWIPLRWHRKKDGTVFPVEISGGYFEYQGRKIHVAAIRDITARRRSEDSLKESEQRLRTLVHTMGEGVIFQEASGKILSWNKAAERIFGLSEDEAIGQTSTSRPWAVYHEDGSFFAGAEHPSMVTLSTGLPCNNVIMRVDNPNGKQYWISINTRPFFDSNGNKPSAVVISFSDITERKLAEERLLDYQAKLRAMASELSLAEERERRRIASDLHDHLGQILATSKFRLDRLQGLLEDGTDETEVVAIKELIEQAIHYTRSLTVDLSPPVLHVFGISAALEWLGAQMQEKHGVIFQVDHDQQTPLMDDDAQFILFQVVRELFHNIVKHSKASKATVSIRDTNGEVRVCVVDDGIGFDPSSVGNDLIYANSFGYFTIRERLSFLGGRVSIESTPGKGTRVTVTAPLVLVKNGGQQQ